MPCGVIRIGFNADRLPIAFLNARGDLVGFDIDMAHHLAHDLGVEIEFVPFETNTMAQQLEADHFDLIMSGVAGSPSRYEQMLFTDSYLDGTPALVMKDHVLRNAMVPIITVAGIQLASLLGGVIVVEVVFAWPGLGRLVYDSVLARDYTVVQGAVLLVAAIFLVANIVVDALYALIDPRIRVR